MDRHCTIFFLLFLSVLIFIGEVIDGASGKSIVDTKVFPLNKMPSAARKAGGSLKTNSLDPTNSAMEEKIIADHRSDLPTPLSSTESSSSSNKLNSNLNQENVEKSVNNLKVGENNNNNMKIVHSKIHKEVDIYSEEIYSEEDEEEDCPRGKYWHIRGLRCVPNKCPMGNSLRNQNTGECLHIDYNSSSGSIKDKGQYCIEKHIMPYGACCHKVMSQPHLTGGNNMRFQIVSRNTYKKYPRKHITRG